MRAVNGILLNKKILCINSYNKVLTTDFISEKNIFLSVYVKLLVISDY